MGRLTQREIDAEWPAVDVAIFTEGTYPFLRGGVSSVIHEILKGNPDFDVGIVHITWDRSSRHEWAFEQLPHVKWVRTLYLSPDEQPRLRQPLFRVLGGASQTRSAGALFGAIESLAAGDGRAFRQFYVDHVDPLRHGERFWAQARSRDMVEAISQRFTDARATYADLLWLQSELFSLARTILGAVYPKASLYHSHTTGYAGMAATVASWQRGGNFLLSEHALYVRDALKHHQTEIPLSRLPQRGPLPIATLRNEVWRSWFRLMSLLIYQSCDQGVYLYPRIVEEAGTYGFDRRKAVIVPNGVTPALFRETQARQTARRAVREALRRGEGRWQIGFIGRVVPIKGVLDLLRAAQLLKRSELAFDLFIVGPDDEEPDYVAKCKSAVVDYGLEEHVHFTGPRNVREVLADLDLVVLSSHSEALPMVLLEAMVAGIPSVSTDVGSVREVLGLVPGAFQGTTAEPAGLVTPPRDPRALAQAIRALLEDEAAFDSMAACGPGRVAKFFNSENMHLAYGELYRKFGGKNLDAAK